ncbi:MAG: glycosyltransferase [Treponemataceae bacterium]
MINILFTCDENYAIFLNIAIVSILKNAKKNDEFEFFIMHPDLSTKTKINIENFKKIHNFKINFIQIDLKKELNFYTASGVWESKLCFLRIKAPLILKKLGYKLDKLLYLDTDIIVNESLNQLFLIDLEEYEVGAVASPIAEEEIKHFQL